MAKRTPEWKQMREIVKNLLYWLQISAAPDGGIEIAGKVYDDLAAPLEAANARIKELEAEIAPLRQFVGHSLVMSDYRTADEMRTQIAKLREAVRVLAAVAQYSVVPGWDAAKAFDAKQAVNANSTALAAIEAARKDHT
jgi:hypothetical protein